MLYPLILMNTSSYENWGLWMLCLVFPAPIYWAYTSFELGSLFIFFSASTLVFP